MKQVLLFSFLLVLGMIGSQLLPGIAGEAYPQIGLVLRFMTMIGLAFIMIHVGFEFEIDKSNLRQYGWDYVVAITASAFPWILASAYFVFVLLPSDMWNSGQAWKESLLAGRFAAPTSAGVLFAMLAAAGLSATWVFKKARILAIFEDVDTVLLMIPLQLLVVGLSWQPCASIAIMLVLLWMAWRYLHYWPVPATWPWVMSYSLAIVAMCELIHFFSKVIHDTPMDIEVLLPAFVLGCMMKRPTSIDSHGVGGQETSPAEHQSAQEKRVSTIMSGSFMVLVGLNMPQIIGNAGQIAPDSPITTVTAAQPLPVWWMIGVHVVILTVLINLGKLFPLFCYRREAHWKERLALTITLWPRGEVGAGVLMVSLSYGIGGPIVTVALLCLSLNLILTGGFIVAVKKLIAKVERTPSTSPNACAQPQPM